MNMYMKWYDIYTPKCDPTHAEWRVDVAQMKVTILKPNQGSSASSPDLVMPAQWSCGWNLQQTTEGILTQPKAEISVIHIFH